MLLVLTMLTLTTVSAATQQQILVELKEFVTQDVRFNPLKNWDSGVSPWHDADENQTNYATAGYIIVSNTNPTEPMSDIYLEFDHSTNITLPTLYQGRTGTWRMNDTASGSLLLHIPEILAGQNSTWYYVINTSLIRPPLNFTTVYSDAKLLAGDDIILTDTIHNVFDNEVFQTDTCIYDINITQKNIPINFSNSFEDYLFRVSSTTGLDGTNVSYDLTTNQTQYWDAMAGGCLNKGEFTNIVYNVTTPENIPTTTYYDMLNTTIEYKLNQTFSHLRLINIEAISEASVDIEKSIVQPSDPILHGSNVTWNVTGFMSVYNNISYLLRETTMWVSQRGVSGGFTDPNTVDNDSIDGSLLSEALTPLAIVNKSQRWQSFSWLFNYSDIPSPIAWTDINFTIHNDGIQLINRSVVQTDNDVYIKELYLIISYWLEITKNVTALDNNNYNIQIDVHNKGNQVTPAGTIVTIYDFMPKNFSLNGTMLYSASPWYDTAETNNSISGLYEGKLFQWALVPEVTNIYNTSFAQGPGKNVNTTWSVNYNVTGFGDYQLMDVFVTGLDPQLVDGAGSTNAVIISEVLERIRSTEGIFAAIASVLLLLGLLL